VCVFQHACASKIGQTVCLDEWMNEWMDGNSIWSLNLANVKPNVKNMQYHIFKQATPKPHEESAKIRAWDYADKTFIQSCTFFPLTVCVRDQQNPPDSFRDQNEEQSCTPDCLKLILNECRQITPLSLTKKARIINVIFLALYIFTDIVFMSVLWSYWYIP